METSMAARCSLTQTSPLKLDQEKRIGVMLPYNLSSLLHPSLPPSLPPSALCSLQGFVLPPSRHLYPFMLDGGLFIAAAVASTPGTVEQSIIEEQVLTNSSADFYSRYKTRPHMHTFVLQSSDYSS